MNKIAFMFPGQGSQAVGMGQDLYENFQSARKIFDTANDILKKDIKKLCFEGPEEELKQTINTQSCLLTVSIAAMSAFYEKTNNSIKPDYTLGILGANEEIIKECLVEASIKGLVSVANYNEPNQIVITGEADAVNYAGELIKQKGAKRVVPLAVSGGFHSKLMQSASDEFVDFVKTLEIKNATIPVVTNVDANLTVNKEDFIQKMPVQISNSVYWTQSIQKLVELGVDTFIEFGSGKVLSGLNRKICPDTVKTYNVSDTASLNSVIDALNLMSV